ncbi:hypothetical protein B0H12DRAFT_263638 [Mycena haematopus]|nr:hypothetical protein B0H12DRAFT_263638 [Mycena haematopus]
MNDVISSGEAYKSSPSLVTLYSLAMFRSTIARSAIARPSAARAFHATPAAQKTVTEKVADAADKVNKDVGKGLASAIESGQQAAAATKNALGGTTAEGKKKAGEAATVVGQKKNEAAASARETKDQTKDDLAKATK